MHARQRLPHIPHAHRPSNPAQAVRNARQLYPTLLHNSIIGFSTGAVLGTFSPGLGAPELFRQFRGSDGTLSNQDAKILFSQCSFSCR